MVLTNFEDEEDDDDEECGDDDEQHKIDDDSCSISSTKNQLEGQTASSMKVKSLDDLLFVQKLGQGKYGLVLLACHKDDESKLYAVKVLSKAQLIKENRVETAFTERRILEQLSDSWSLDEETQQSNFVHLECTF